MNPIEAGKELMKLSIPQGWELYDFGGGMTVCPKPDLRPQDEAPRYLSRYMAAIWRYTTLGSRTYSIAFEFDHESEIAGSFRKAVEANQAYIEAVNFVIGQTLAGCPVEVENVGERFRFNPPPDNTEPVVTIRMPLVAYRMLRRSLEIQTRTQNGTISGTDPSAR